MNIRDKVIARKFAEDGKMVDSIIGVVTAKTTSFVKVNSFKPEDCYMQGEWWPMQSKRAYVQLFN